MSLESLMTTTVSLQVQQTGQDTSGAPTRGAYTTDIFRRNVPATIQPASSQVRLDYSQRNLRVTSQIYLLRNIEARPQHRLLDDKTGRKYIVHGYGDEAGRGRLWVADVEEVLQ